MKIFQASWHNPTRRLSSDDCFDATLKCPICLFNGDRRNHIILQKNPLIRLLECPQCRGISASYMPTTDYLKEYYSGYYDGIDRDKGDVNITFHEITRLANHIVKYIDIPKTERLFRILDFGGGDGTLAITIARALQSNHSNYQVKICIVDYNAPESRQMGDITIDSTQELNTLSNDAPFDLVLASAILEHIPEPRATYLKLFDLMKVGGFFYARTPYITPIMRLIPVIDFTFPGHVHDLGPSFWNRLPETFKIDASVVVSQPSIVETQFSKLFMRTLLAYLLKFPAYVENRFNRSNPDKLWNFVGGWEIVFRKSS